MTISLQSVQRIGGEISRELAVLHARYGADIDPMHAHLAKLRAMTAVHFGTDALTIAPDAGIKPGAS